MKKGLIQHFFITCSLMIFAWLFMLSFEIGNLAFLAEDNFTYNVGYNTSIFMITFLVALLICNNEVIEFDLKSGWRRFSMSIPVSPVEKALVKTIFKLILTAAAFIIQLLNYTVICAITGKEFKSNYLMIFLLILAICLLVDLITTAFMLAAKNEKSMALSNAAPIILAIPLFLIGRYLVKDLQDIAKTFINDHADMTDDEKAMEMIGLMFNYIKDVFSHVFVFVIPSIVVIFAAGFIINTMILKRRDK